MSPSPRNSPRPGAGNLGQGSGQCQIIGIVTRHSQQSELSEHKYCQGTKYAGCSVLGIEPRSQAAVVSSEHCSVRRPGPD